MNKSDFNADGEFPEEDEYGRVLVGIELEIEQEVDENDKVIGEVTKRVPIYKVKQEHIETSSPIVTKTFHK
jgi:hypothetical protein